MVESLMQRNRAVIAAGLFVVAGLAWLYIVRQAHAMGQMRAAAWSAADFSMTLLMWIVMMVAMMTPSVTPMVLAFAATSEKRRQESRPYVPATVFLVGYLSVWAAFSLAATAAQWALHSAALLSPMMVSTSPYLGSSILLVAGIFQWTPLKKVCLVHCRSPLGFLLTHWRPGTSGAFLMGVSHGGYCTGCCWALMSLLFVAGVMNLLWVGILCAFVLTEKILPRGELVARTVGGVLILTAIVILNL